MQRPIQITFRGMDPSEAVEQRVREKAAALETYFDRLIGCHVVVESPHRHSQQGNLYHVTVELSVPGGPPIVVGREHHDKQAHEDVYVAIRDAFGAARRRLQDHARKLRADVKVHEVPTHGRVVRKFSDERYGFVEDVAGTEVYFHANAVVDGRFEDLEIGTEVRFALHPGEGEKGPQASTVRLIGKHHLPDVGTTRRT